MTPGLRKALLSGRWGTFADAIGRAFEEFDEVRGDLGDADTEEETA